MAFYDDKIFHDYGGAIVETYNVTRPIDSHRVHAEDAINQGLTLVM